MSNGPILFEEIFEVKSVNPDGKAFDKGKSQGVPLNCSHSLRCYLRHLWNGHAHRY